MKYIYFSALLLCSVMNCSARQEFKFMNKTDIPCIAQVYYSAEQDRAGVYGFAIPAGKNTKLSLKEDFWWFDKVGMGGLKKQGEKSRVTTKEVLKHHKADKLEVVIPNVGVKEFDLGLTEEFTVKIAQNKDDQVQVELKAVDE